MLPEPLHPAIVHFPIVLALIVPPLAIGIAWAIHTRRLSGRSWIGVLIAQIAVAGSAWVAVETGEHEEERVEEIVAERHIEGHEESAERVLAIAGLGVALAGAGLMARRLGTLCRVLFVVLSLAAVWAVAETGHSGGELVYRHGAAAAYATPQAGPDATSGARSTRERHDDDD